MGLFRVKGLNKTGILPSSLPPPTRNHNLPACAGKKGVISATGCFLPQTVTLRKFSKNGVRWKELERQMACTFCGVEIHLYGGVPARVEDLSGVHLQNRHGEFL